MKKNLPYNPGYKVMALFSYCHSRPYNEYKVIVPPTTTFKFAKHRPTRFFKTPNGLVSETRPWLYNRGDLFGNVGNKNEQQEYVL